MSCIVHPSIVPVSGPRNDIFCTLEGSVSPNSCAVKGKAPFVLVVLRLGDLGDALVEIMRAHGAHPHQRLPDGCTPLFKVR